MNNSNEHDETKHVGDTEEVATRWQNIKKLFGAASALTGKEREKFLKKSCGDDADLRAEVEKLLRSFEDSETFLEKGVAAEFADLIEEKQTLIGQNTTGDISRGSFVAGTVLASRYRIIGMIGKGGMGEVYKAEDIKLSQTVALKFLPDNFQKDSAALERFHAEVRNARQVSHVNVCRVFDIGEIEGRHFLSMEFVDGDDLSSLLRRVGRLSSERAIEIARQLCVGLSAIHNAGILHRDFKPANVIIDSKGKARITDFGIAGVEAEINKDNLRVGTPAYMSPEQITGRDVSAKSDIYALGLVLYEIFTGRQAVEADSIPELIRKQTSESPTNVSEFVKGIDPLVESVIKQCIEKDPKDRPASALHVAMALPGGNPMQIALDAGQTPSPEMVAASPKKGALRPAVALSLLAVVLIGIGIITLTSKQTYLHRIVPLEKSEDVLEERAKELTEKFGYRGADSYHAFYCPCNYDGYLKHLVENDQSMDRWQKLAKSQPATIEFFYRTSPSSLVPVRDRKTTWTDPENNVPGMSQLRLDTKGRLLVFAGVPLRVDEPVANNGEFDWASVLKEAGFEISKFKPVDPQWTPPVAFDDRRAFAGVYPDSEDIAIRIEVAAYRGKLVRFEIVEPWTVPPVQNQSPQIGVPAVVMMATYFGIIFLSAWLAVRNVRAGRGDLKGALRVAVFMFGARMVIWTFATHNLADVRNVGLLISGMQAGLYWAGMAAFMYLAVEPYLRKSAPERIVSWTRLLSGDWRNPLVGRDILIGGAIGLIALVAEAVVMHLVPFLQGKPAPEIYQPRGRGPGGASFVGIIGFPDLFLETLSESLIVAFIISFLILLLSLIFRRKLLGTLAVWVFSSVLFIVMTVNSSGSINSIVGLVIFQSALIFVASRFGVLSVISFQIFSNLGIRPVTTDLSAWYASEFVLYSLVVIGLSVFGYVTSTAGAKMFGGKSFLADSDSVR